MHVPRWIREQGSQLRAERGATAVLMALILVFVLLPAAALSLTTMVRSATAAEVQRSADAAALAGARAIPVGVLGTVTGSPGAPPETVACDMAEKAAHDDSALGRDYSADDLDCDAQRSAPNITTRFKSCVDLVLGPVTVPTLPGVPDPTALFSFVREFLPILDDQSMTVTLTRTFHGDGLLDGMFGDPGDTKREETRSAIARRRPKAVVRCLGDLATNCTLADASFNSTFDLLENTIATVAPECAQAAALLQEDIDDAFGAGRNAPPSEEVIADAMAADAPAVIVAVSPAGGDVLMSCDVVVNGGLVIAVPPDADCLARAPGAFRAWLVRD